MIWIKNIVVINKNEQKKTMEGITNNIYLLFPLS